MWPFDRMWYCSLKCKQTFVHGCKHICEGQSLHFFCLNLCFGSKPICLSVSICLKCVFPNIPAKEGNRLAAMNSAIKQIIQVYTQVDPSVSVFLVT